MIFVCMPIFYYDCYYSYFLRKHRSEKSVFLIDTLPELLCIVMLTYTEKGCRCEMYIIQLYNYQ